ncbi:hypothetical protein Cgig2_021828 [Carnegiea gigantea]|uniref:Uncharacterized protein n=1 Tax=Carnegiea gigantea TaxID=171969 RepID=A0A9Q1QLI5_9CARY|nr:hypothetical protein Cgig2_021828 [Carnegiea gigantea]
MAAHLTLDLKVACRTFAFKNRSSGVQMPKKISGINRLEGKVALITGGASGLGKAIAQEFSQQGAHVSIADINAKLGSQVAKNIGIAAHFIQCDVTDEAQVDHAVDAVMTHKGKLNIMFNNARVAGPQQPPSIVDLDLDQFDKVMQINVRATFTGIKHASRVMIPAKSGVDPLQDKHMLGCGWARPIPIFNIKVHDT